MALFEQICEEGHPAEFSRTLSVPKIKQEDRLRQRKYDWQIELNR